MADFAQMIYGTAQNTAQEQGKGISEGVKTGTELALKMEQNQLAKQTLAQKKQELDGAMMGKLYDYVKDSSKFKSPSARNNYLKSAINFRNTLGIPAERVPDDVILQLGHDENQGRMTTLDRMYATGQMDQKELEATLRDPQLFAKVVPTVVEGIEEDTNIRKTIDDKLTRASQERQAQARADASVAKGEGVDRRFAQSQKTKLVDKVNALGLPSLKTAVNELEGEFGGNIDSWKAGQRIPGISGGEGALPLNRLRGRAAKVRGAAQSIGNQILKLRSGAAVTDGEAMRTLAELGMVPTIGDGGTWTGLTFKGITDEGGFVNGMKRAKGMLGAVESTFRNAYGEDVYDSVLKPNAPASASASPASGGTFKVGGRDATLQQIKGFLNSKFAKDNPNDPTVKESQAVLKAQGG